MPTLSPVAIDHARALVMAWLAKAPAPEHGDALWLAACGRRPPRAGAVPYYWLSEHLRGVVDEARRHHLLRAAVDRLVGEGKVDAWRTRGGDGKQRTIWVALKGGRPPGPCCPCCGCDLADLFRDWEGDE